MKGKMILPIVIFVILLCSAVRAGVSDFAGYFDIDLEKDKLPTLAELEVLLLKEDDYNKKYGSFYDLLDDFDQEFYTTLAAYGTQEKRMKGVSEDLYLEFLAMLPKKYYQYVGPALWEVPNMSDKVLNLPGIKETKNKFPTRIASQLKDVENLEFLSPSYYFLLMPEAWPGYREKIEMPQMTPYHPKVKYDPQFYALLKKLVVPEKYMPGYKAEAKFDKTDLRTLYPDKDTILTAADIKAFISTVDAVEDWANNDNNAFLLARVGTMLSLYEKQDERGRFVPAGLADLVNPCARLVQKTRLVGKERELAMIVGKSGFTLNEWAYTCDKSIKAYRLANIRSDVVASLRGFKRGLYDGQLLGVSPLTSIIRFSLMQGIIKAYEAPLSDVMAYRKNREEFDDMLFRHDFNLFGVPVHNF